MSPSLLFFKDTDNKHFPHIASLRQMIDQINHSTHGLLRQQENQPIIDNCANKKNPSQPL
jgi:hypothetical protein